MLAFIPDFGAHAVFVWPGYGLGLLGMIFLIVRVRVRVLRYKKNLKAFEKMQKRDASAKNT